MNKLFYSLLITISLLACKGSDAILQEHSFAPNGWSSSDIVTFTDVHASSTASTYLRITHTPDYGYENLYINLTTDTMTKLYDHDISHLVGNLSKTISLEQYSRDPILAEVKSIKLIQKP